MQPTSELEGVSLELGVPVSLLVSVAELLAVLEEVSLELAVAELEAVSEELAVCTGMAQDVRRAGEQVRATAERLAYTSESGGARGRTATVVVTLMAGRHSHDKSCARPSCATTHPRSSAGLGCSACSGCSAGLQAGREQYRGGG